MLTYTPANNIYDGLITNLFSVLCILTEVLSRAHAKEEKSLNNFKFGIFIGTFSSDDVTSIAIKGLIPLYIAQPLKI